MKLFRFEKSGAVGLGMVDQHGKNIDISAAGMDLTEHFFETNDPYMHIYFIQYILNIFLYNLLSFIQQLCRLHLKMIHPSYFTITKHLIPKSLFDNIVLP